MKQTPALSLRLPKALARDLPEPWPDFPSCTWPKTLRLPNFKVWRATGRTSAVRNLIALFLLELGVTRDEAALFLELSPTRTLAIAREMRIKLFGKEFKKYEEGLGKEVALASTGKINERLLHFALEKKHSWPQVKLQAIAFAMDWMASEYHDFQLWHATVQFLV